MYGNSEASKFLYPLKLWNIFDSFTSLREKGMYIITVDKEFFMPKQD